MNMYLVGWPDLTVSFVVARDEAHLCTILSMRADPAQCRWRRREGTMWIDLVDEGVGDATTPPKGMVPVLDETDALVARARAEGRMMRPAEA